MADQRSYRKVVYISGLNSDKDTIKRWLNEWFERDYKLKCKKTNVWFITTPKELSEDQINTLKYGGKHLHEPNDSTTQTQSNDTTTIKPLRSPSPSRPSPPRMQPLRRRNSIAAAAQIGRSLISPIKSALSPTREAHKDDEGRILIGDGP
ncbi:hypothetical protein B0T17DRAFT_510244 [Bombardia bombarda]|uniref:Uncharacterized protein n=1 Tax=Bombardia bombarda TaxID=252184 RepID=A0AA39WHU5_9PEZI|nr:hypothetical protein B0T17DRAFT_510244 [Bombardia bombarda]